MGDVYSEAGGIVNLDSPVGGLNLINVGHRGGWWTVFFLSRLATRTGNPKKTSPRRCSQHHCPLGTESIPPSCDFQSKCDPTSRAGDFQSGLFVSPRRLNFLSPGRSVSVRTEIFQSTHWLELQPTVPLRGLTHFQSGLGLFSPG